MAQKYGSIRLDTMPDKERNDAETSQDTRKRRRTRRGSQTDDEPSKSEESNPQNKMSATLAEINSKLELALAGIKEIEELIKEKQHLMEKENSDLSALIRFVRYSREADTMVSGCFAFNQSVKSCPLFLLTPTHPFTMTIASFCFLPA